MKCDKCGYDWGDSGDSAHACAFYQTLKPSTHSPQRTWVGLTDEEVITMSRYDLEYAALIGEVQRKLKEKNT